MVVVQDLASNQRCAEGVAVALRGVLSGSDNAHLTRTFARKLRESRVVVVDTSRLRLRSDAAPRFLSNALIRAGGWPKARMIVVGADPRLKAALATSGVARDVLMVDDVDRAHAYAHLRPERVARRIQLSDDRWSIQRAVAFVTPIRLAWAVPDHVVDDAQRVVQELVDNAVRHARTASVLQVSLDAAGLRIAVRDFRARAEVTPCGGRDCEFSPDATARILSTDFTSPRPHNMPAKACGR